MPPTTLFEALIQPQTLQTLIGAGIAAVSSCWVVWTWFRAQREKRESEERDAERLAHARRTEATRPFLEKQLALYADAARVCAQIASGDDSMVAVTRFWELYWGELAMVENKGVEGAMVRFGQALFYMPENKSELQQRALELAGACRQSLARSWGVEAWVTPDAASVRTLTDIAPMPVQPHRP